MPKTTKRPSKGKLVPNQDYLKDWDEYEAARPGRTPILLPILIGIDGNGEITRKRMKSAKVAKLAKRLHKDLPKYMFDRNLTKHDPQAIFDDYVDFFHNDGKQGPILEGPLDVKVTKPVWMLYYFPQKAWKFTKSQQFSTVNDPDDMTRNFVKIATMDNRNGLLLANRFRSGPKNLKFNLHVTITQVISGRKLETPMIIDPAQNNDDGDHGGWD